MRRSKRGLAILAAAVAAIPAVVSAATDTWTGTGAGSTWTDPGNWNAGTGNAPPLANDLLQFAGTTNLTTNNNFAANTQFNGIAFNSGAGAFTLGGNAVILGGDINNNSASAETISLGLVLNGAASNINNSGGGTLALGSLTFGSAAQSTTVSTLNVNNTVSALNLLNQTNTATPSTINIASGQALNLSGTTGVGSSGAIAVFGTPATTATAVVNTSTISGAGSFNVTTTTQNFIVGVGSGNNNFATMNTTLDMSGLANFSYTAGTTGTGVFDVGVGTRPAATLRLANTSNSITAANLTVGDSTQTPGFTGLGTNNNAGGTSTLFLGAGTNVIDVSGTINLGNAKGVGVIQFGGATGSVVIAGQTGGASNVGTINVGRESSGSGSTGLNQVLLAGHNATIQATNLNVAVCAGSSAASNGAMTFDTGTITAGTFQLAVHSSGAGSAVGTYTQGGGTLTVTTAFNLANQTVAGTATGVFNLNGGTVTTSIDILDASTTGTHTGTLNLNGGALNMNGHAIGSAATPVTLNLPASGSATISSLGGAGVNGAGLAMTGAGTLILGGANTYSNNTNINTGTLAVNGTLANTSNVNVNSGGTLAGNGNGTTSGLIGGNVTMNAGSELKAGALGTDGNIGTLTVTGAFNVGGGDFRVDTGAANASDQVVANGGMTFNNPATVSVVPGATAGIYTIINAPGGLTNVAADLTLTQTIVGRATYSLDFSTLNKVKLDVIGGPASLIWNNSSPNTGDGATWDIQSNQNWKNGGGADVYFEGDNVTFGDTNNGHYSVNVSGTVNPGSVTVNNSAGDYTIGGGTIGGVAGLSKLGSSKLTLTGNNTYSGVTSLGGTGTLSISSDANIGAAPAAATPGSLVLSSGNLQATAGFTLNANRGVAIGPSSGSGSASVEVVNPGDTFEIAGVISNNGSGTGGLTKIGPGTLKLSGSNSFTGNTTISNGTLLITNSNSVGSTTGGSVTVSGTGSTFDIGGNATANNLNFGTKQFFIAGTGVGNHGALTNSSAVAQQNAYQKVTLTADATVGGAGRFDIRGTGSTLDLAGHTLTKVDANTFTLSGPTATDGNIDVLAGTFSIESASTVLGGGTGTITYDNTANANVRAQFFQNTGTVTRPMFFIGSGIVTGNAGNTAGAIGSNMTLEGDITVEALNTNGSGTITFSGNIGELGGSHSITKANNVNGNSTAASTLILSGANTYSGGTTITGGVLTASSASSLGTGDVSVNPNGANGTAIDAATLNVGNNTALGPNANLTVNTNSGTQIGTVNFNTAAPVIATLAGTGNVVLNNATGTNLTVGNGSSTVFSGVISNGAGTGSITKAGAGSLTLGGVNTYTGTTTVSAGTLAIGASASIANSSTFAVGASGTLDVSAQGGSFTVGSTQTLQANGIVTGGFNLNGTLSGTGNAGAVTTQGGSSIRTGATAADGTVGTLHLSSLADNGGDWRIDLASGNQSDELVVNGLASFAGGSTITPSAVTPPSGTYTLLTSTGLSGAAPTVVSNSRTQYTLHFGDGISGVNNITLNVVAAAPKTIFWKGNDVNDNTAWDLNNHANWTDGAITEHYFDFDNVVFDDVHSPVNRNVSLNINATPGSVVIDNSTAPYTISGGGSIIGATGLTKRGTNSLTLSTNNTYTGLTTIENGTLILGTSNAIPTNGSVTLGAGPTSGALDLNGSNPIITNLATAGTGNTNVIASSTGTSALTVAGGTSTFAGAMQDNFGPSSGQSVALTLNGGSLTLTGTNTYTNLTTINTGATLQLGAGGASGTLSPTTSIGDNGVLIVNHTDPVVLSNNISGSGELRQSGTGTTTLLGSNSYVATTINAGALQIGNGSTAGNLGSGAVVDAGTLVFNRSDSITISNVISGSGGLSEIGPDTGITTLTGANTYQGTTTITSGTLQTSTNASLGSLTSGVVNISGTGTLDIGGNATANNVNFGAKQFNIAGNGVGGLGAIINSNAAGQNNAFQKVTLTADASIGGTGRFDVRGGTPVLDLAGHTLTKLGTNQFTVVSGTMTDGNVIVNGGVFSLEQTTVALANASDSTSITFNANTVAQFFSNTAAVSTITRRYIINGAGVVMGSGSSANTSVIGSPITLNADLTFAPQNGGAATGNLNLTGIISDGSASHGIMKNGTNTVILSGANTYTGTTNVTAGTLNVVGSLAPTNPVIAGGPVNFSGTTVATAHVQQLSSLSIASGITCSVTSSTLPFFPTTLQPATLTLADTSSKIDLTNNILIANGAASDALNLINSGQVFSSAGTANLGYITLNPSNYEIRWTLLGDTNLDGKVNVSDLGNLATNFGSTSATWIQGDFDRSGTVNVADLGDLATNFGQTLAGGSSFGATGSAASPAAVAGSASVAAVPEPTSLALLGLGAASLLARRRRRMV